MSAHCFDAGVFLSPMLKNQPARVVALCREWMLRIGRGELDACTSSLTWDEVVWVAARAEGGFDPARAAETGRRFLALPNLRFVPVDRELVAAAQQIMTSARVRPRDSIHAATALRFAGGSLVTVDSDFVSAGVADSLPKLKVVLVKP